MFRTIFKTCVVWTFALLLSLCNASAILAWQNPAPQVAEGDVEVRASRVFTFVDKTGLGHQHGVEGWLKPSQILLNAEQGGGKLVFDMASFDADTDTARKFFGLEGSTAEGTRKQVNDNMKGRDILDTQKYPEAIFTISSSLPTGKADSKQRPEFELKGDFTLHGVTKPLRLLCNVDQTRGWLRLVGHFEIKQTDYGIKPFSKAFGAIGVADTLRIHGAIWVAPTKNLDLSKIPEIK